MPVDEEKLETTIKNLRENLEQDVDIRTQKRQVLQNLEEIEMKPGEAQPDDTEPPSKVMPINARSNKPYTSAERDKQYTDNITRAEVFLA